jgi:hypothetical protein
MNNRELLYRHRNTIDRVNLLESYSDIDQDNLYFLSCIQETIDTLEILSDRYGILTESSDITILNESVRQTILNFMNKIADRCSDKWKKFKEDANDKRILKVVNNENKVYFTTGFKMQFPPKFPIPQMKEYNKFNNTCKVIELNMNTINSIKQYLGSESDFISHFYREYYDENIDFVDSVKNKVFIISTGNEIISTQGILEYVTFLNNYAEQVKSISTDIDKLNLTNRNIQQFLNQLPMDEMAEFCDDMIDILYEVGFGLRFKDAGDKNAVGDPNNPIQIKKDEKEQRKLEAQKKQETKKYIKSYYMASMDVFMAKMKICVNVKNKALKIVSKYVKLQPKDIARHPEKNQNQTQNPAVNTDAKIQIEK